MHQNDRSGGWPAFLKYTSWLKLVSQIKGEKVVRPYTPGEPAPRSPPKCSLVAAALARQSTAQHATRVSPSKPSPGAGFNAAPVLHLLAVTLDHERGFFDLVIKASA